MEPRKNSNKKFLFYAKSLCNEIITVIYSKHDFFVSFSTSLQAQLPLLRWMEIAAQEHKLQALNTNLLLIVSQINYLSFHPPAPLWIHKSWQPYRLSGPTIYQKYSPLIKAVSWKLSLELNINGTSSCAIKSPLNRINFKLQTNVNCHANTHLICKLIDV